ncbi:AAA family ATPase [Bryobacter aggregatus]|uniref:AAA family ATPase n=1 Tax=Bryobacter aggregatus TaxID=360054 RepID=UPI0004E1E6B0|nr:AAA family ATPase [Bryobacter aggregatus]
MHTALSFTTPAAALRKAATERGDFIKNSLGVSIDETVAIETDFSFTSLALDHLFGGRFTHGANDLWPKARPHVQSIRFANELPQLRATAANHRIHSNTTWTADLHDIAFALQFDFLPAPIVVVVTQNLNPTRGGGFYEENRQLVLLRAVDLPALLDHTYRWTTSGKKRVQVFSGEDFYLDPNAYSWDDVLLDDNAQALVRKDFENFLARREWFAQRRVPWRRGYLLHGAPGNGKTSVVRAMASHPDIAAFSINLAQDDVYDITLSQLFSAASNHAPGLVILEEIDRLFAEGKKEDLNCTLSHLLNYLDGVGNQEGVIVVATANHPELLDQAILKRPGRFDRVVHFPAPTEALRLDYLARMCRKGVARTKLAAIAKRSERMSFAQLREIWLLGCQFAFDGNRDLSYRDLDDALIQVQSEQRGGHKRQPGFAVA